MPRSARCLSDVGEAELVERIARRAGHPPDRAWPLSIGDDAALLRPRSGEDLVLSVDAQVEGSHFRWGREGPALVGRRALAVSLSDLAAMGARPVGSLLSFAAPRRFRLRDFDACIEGFVAEGRTYGCPLVGGNLARAAAVSLHVTVVGAVGRGAGLRRGRLRPGDGLYVTGTLGGAALARHRADRRGTRARHVPTARIEAGRRLARWSSAVGCIDLSDGLATDLPNMLAGSGCGAEVDVAALPRPRGFEAGCKALGLDPDALLLRGGEDYELLFALRPPARGRLFGEAALGRRLGVPVRRIGAVRADPGLVGLGRAGAGHHF